MLSDCLHNLFFFVENIIKRIAITDSEIILEAINVKLFLASVCLAALKFSVSTTFQQCSFLLCYSTNLTCVCTPRAFIFVYVSRVCVYCTIKARVCVCMRVYTYVPAASGFRSFVLQHSACLPPQEIQGSLSSGHTKALAFFEVLKTSIYAFPGQKAPGPIFESIGNTGRHCGHASSALISQILKPVCGEQDFSS